MMPDLINVLSGSGIILTPSQKVQKYRFPSFRPGSESGMTAKTESRLFRQLQTIRTPVFTGVTTSSETVNIRMSGQYFVIG